MSLLLPIEAPKHWQRRRIQAVFHMYGGGTPAKENLKFWGGEIPWVSPKDMKTSFVSSTEDTITEQAVASSATRIVPAGCLLIVVRSGILKHSIPTAIASKAVSLNQDIKALVPIEPVDTRYVRYMLTGHEKLLLTVWRSLGATVESLDSERIKQSTIPLPSLSTQKAIADYLDDKTAAIDALIEKKRKLLDLLAEERTALINQAVTKGLDPTVPMKDSGIPWMGEIPAHWEVVQLKRKWSIIDCKHRTPEYLSEGFKVVSTTEVKPGRIDLSLVSRLIGKDDFNDMTEGSRKPQFGDIVYSRNASLGAAAYIDTEEPFAMGQDVVLITSKRQNQLYLSQLLNSPICTTQVNLACVGATFKRINVGQIRKTNVCLPPREEQDSIANYIDNIDFRFTSMREILERQIGRLQEYRQALITAAVTGQLDIEAAA
ncbi:restriction endonuclease subunit S [Marichromatium purpuratum]|nr:restriction endonuclease subunit S [Marichromatium purpuratum]